MCMIRDNDENCDRFVYPLHILNAMETIDLTMDDLADDDDFVEITQRGDLWNYPYNLLPSTDEEEPVIVLNMLQHNTVHLDTIQNP